MIDRVDNKTLMRRVPLGELCRQQHERQAVGPA